MWTFLAILLIASPLFSFQWRYAGNDFFKINAIRKWLKTGNHTFVLIFFFHYGWWKNSAHSFKIQGFLFVFFKIFTYSFFCIHFLQQDISDLSARYHLPDSSVGASNYCSGICCHCSIEGVPWLVDGKNFNFFLVTCFMFSLQFHVISYQWYWRPLQLLLRSSVKAP